MENNKTIRKQQIFVDGAISPEFIAQSIAKHSTKKTIGAHDIFLGQVREDNIEGKKVTAIEYTAFIEEAEERIKELREETFSKYDLTCMHIYHSLGTVKTGEICLFVFVSSAHRQMAFDANRFVVEAIKKRIPVWGKELLEDTTHIWKENK
jgi:molybdopterin synthase catalytic subunit